MRMEENNDAAIESVNVAIFWFAALVYIFFSWIFYWIVHRLKLKAWLIAQVLALIIAAVATLSLLYVSRDHQQRLEQKAMQQEQDSEKPVLDGTESTSEDDTVDVNPGTGE